MRLSATLCGAEPLPLNPSHLSFDLVPSKFCCAPQRVLVDSGATDSFVDATFVENLGLRTSPLPSPISLKLFDSSPSSSPVLTHFILWSFDLPGFPPLEWKLLVANLPSTYQVVLGHDFLFRWNPIVDWSNGTFRPRQSPDPIESSSAIPATPAVTSTVPSTISVTPAVTTAANLIHPSNHLLVPDELRYPSPSRSNVARLRSTASGPLFDDDEDPDEVENILSAVPKEYHDFIDVFSKVRAERLPPHRFYDHKFEFEGPLPPPGPVYSVSKKVQSVLKEYLDDMIARGYIRPSNSSFGAPLLFAKKKDGSLRPCIDYRKINALHARFDIRSFLLIISSNRSTRRRSLRRLTCVVHSILFELLKATNSTPRFELATACSNTLSCPSVSPMLLLRFSERSTKCYRSMSIALSLFTLTTS